MPIKEKYQYFHQLLTENRKYITQCIKNEFDNFHKLAHAQIWDNYDSGSFNWCRNPRPWGAERVRFTLKSNSGTW